jgi:BASS family bile acid:Na+ symporter
MMNFFKNWALMIAMIAGAVFHDWFAKLFQMVPYLLFAMLFITFCRIDPAHMKLRRLHAWLIVLQLAGGLALYFGLEPFDVVLAQGVLLCVLPPAATSSSVITGMLGGDVAFMATFTLLNSLSTAVAAPILFSFIGTNSILPFVDSFLQICGRLFPLLVLPLALAWAVRLFLPGVHARMLRIQMLSFHLWVVTLTVLMANTVNFVLTRKEATIPSIALLAGAALAVCAVQFAAGRKLGLRHHDPISAAQGMGQKNMALGVWMAFIYASPLAAIAPASYICWQNLFNSYQIWRYQKSRA